ncbi:tRNA (adenosine(37)-N6)-dimethylallyltransferase MiaA [bacterium]|nr:tRNA (adenosine(37)-N6)-dimethylallyltransferase MiaA [bacterium]
MTGYLCPVIAGPTAVGKTGLIVALAARYPVEVISLDSRQLYRGLHIGTAQPSAEEQAACAHHLVDFLSPGDTYSAQRFREDFQRVYGEIRAHDAIPVLVGGAGLYLTALREGFFPIPEDAPDLDALRAELDALDDETVRARLLIADPDSHDRIHPHDRYRSQRALEILRLTGRTMTEIRATREPDPSLGLSFPLVLLERDPEELRRRIALRTMLMLETGWLEETTTLLQAHGPDVPGLKTLGYQELVRHLQGETTLAEAVDTIVRDTARYAKRQRTWFRRQEAAAAGHPDDPTILSAVTNLVARAATSE